MYYVKRKVKKNKIKEVGNINGLVVKPKSKAKEVTIIDKEFANEYIKKQMEVVNMNEVKVYEEKDIEVLGLIKYLSDHPIVFIGFSLAGLILSVSILIDKKYNQ